MLRGHSVSLRVTVSGRSQLAAIQEGLVALHNEGVPLDAEWTMAYHQGQEVRNGDPYLEADYIQIDATWAERT